MPPEQQAAPVESPSLRDSIEAAVTTIEKAETSPPQVEAKPVGDASQVITPAPKPPEGEPKVEAKVEPKVEEKVEGQLPAPIAEFDQPPKSWKPAARGTWANVPAEARAEIYRRDRDAIRTLSEAAQARAMRDQIQEAVRPYEAKLRSTGYTLPQMVGELLKADHILSTAGPAARAQYMAKLIKDYEVDIRELDGALSGQGSPNPMQSEVERLVNERLSPLQQFVEQQRRQVEQQDLRIKQDAAELITEMESDPKYPHFDLVREDMADLLELSSKRGIYLDPPMAYARAVAMNPELAAQPAVQQQATLRTAQANNARAQRAISASASVSGQPSGIPGAGGSAGSLRDTIEAAFNQATGR